MAVRGRQQVPDVPHVGPLGVRGHRSLQAQVPAEGLDRVAGQTAAGQTAAAQTASGIRRCTRRVGFGRYGVRLATGHPSTLT